MSILHVMVGLPGSGKSTIVEKALQYMPEAFVYSTDQYIENVAARNGHTYNDAFRDTIGEATKAMDLMLAQAIAKGNDIIWDQTNMSSKKRKAILSKVPSDYFRMAYVIPPPATDQEWVILGVRLSDRPGKNIPAHVVESMASIYTQPTLDEGFDFIRVADMWGSEQAVIRRTLTTINI